jgi:hypothetical protein
MLRKIHVFTEAEFSTGGIWKRCDQVGRNPELNSVTIVIRSLSSPGTRPVSNSSKTNNGNSTYRLVSPCFAVQPGRREGRRESRREKTSELHAMVRESCSRLQLPQPRNFQIPRRFEVRTELNFDGKPKRMATEKTWISRNIGKAGKTETIRKKRLNTIKPVNSLYIRFREFQLTSILPD